MDFKTLKEKAIEMKNKAIEMKDKTLDATVKKIENSSFVIKSQKEMEEFIASSENKTITTKEGETKVFARRVLLICGDAKEEYYKDFLLSFPVLFTKGFSQNVKIKIFDVTKEGFDLSFLEKKEFPSLVVFENKEIYTVIEGVENIKKVIKSLSLDINKTIEDIR